MGADVLATLRAISNHDIYLVNRDTAPPPPPPPPPPLKIKHFVNKRYCILIQIPLEFVRNCLFDYKLELVQAVAWRRVDDKPLFEPIMVRFTDACMRHPTLGFSQLFHRVFIMHKNDISLFAMKRKFSTITCTFLQEKCGPNAISCSCKRTSMINRLHRNGFENLTPRMTYKISKQSHHKGRWYSRYWWYIIPGIWPHLLCHICGFLVNRCTVLRHLTSWNHIQNIL